MIRAAQRPLPALRRGCGPAPAPAASGTAPALREQPGLRGALARLGRAQPWGEAGPGSGS